MTEPTENSDAVDTDEDDGRASDRRLGECIRAIRLSRGMSLQELGRRSGLSNAMVSQLERGLTTPSVRSLRLMSQALQVPIANFFDTEPNPGASPYIVRRAERRMLRLTASGVLKELLSPDRDGPLELYELTISPEGSSGSDFVTHNGLKAGYVLAGRLRLWLDQTPYLLEPGDSFTFPGTLPYMFDNPGKETGRVLWLSAKLET
ncbi:helix-turn-helix transcriptional regulator [Acetobacteraceae bacterium H6797]|nr:helix-turn-helix transcriptional regulator [Acetobacteraceae bacterium H6797]